MPRPEKTANTGGTIKEELRRATRHASNAMSWWSQQDVIEADRAARYAIQALQFAIASMAQYMEES